MRYKRKNTSARRTKPVWFIAIMHVLALGAALNAFALADGALRPETTGRKLPAASLKPAVTGTQAQLQASPSPAATVSMALSETATPQATATEDPNMGMWGAKFPGKFTSGDIQKTDTTYQSHDVSISVEKHEKDGVVYFVADIYIRNLENFGAAFVKDRFGPIDTVKAQASKRNAILAINGDNSGSRNDRLGYEVRNGIEYHTVPDQDVLVMYNDGSMKTFINEDFDYKKEIGTGVWQVWSFGPMLLDENNRAMSRFNSNVPSANPRTAIGYYEPGHYCFLLVDGRQPGYSKGMSLHDMSSLFESLGCKTAYNLDGGQTSVMVFGSGVVNHPYKGGRSTSDIVYICETN